jgi:hypothetical protein
VSNDKLRKSYRRRNGKRARRKKCPPRRGVRRISEIGAGCLGMLFGHAGKRKSSDIESLAHVPAEFRLGAI